MSRTACVQVVIRGTVQGVGFRAATKRIARRFAVDGWVENRRDGSVYVVASGETGDVDGFLAAVKGDPRLETLISDWFVSVYPQDVAKTGFSIQYW